MSKLNPLTTHREFSGLPGAISITLFLPLVLVFFALVTNENYSIKGINLQLQPILDQVPSNLDQLIDLCFDRECWVAYLAWFFGLVIVDQIIPGKQLQGIELRDGSKLNYKINGKLMSLTLIVVLVSRLYTSNDYYLPELQFLYDNQLKLTIVITIFSFLLSFFVYFISFIPLSYENGLGTRERILSVNGNAKNPIYDWFIGRELNPRIGNWDIKLFCELKPGLLLWFLINLSCIQHQYQIHGQVSDSLVLANVLQAFYLFDGVLNEEGVLSMIDITTDGFGFMLCFGDLAWVPWSYSLQSRYLSLSDNYYTLGYFKCSLIIGTSILGYYIFSQSNNQKSEFKQGKLNHLKSIPTKTGSKLLCDGWWKLSQHTNYFGDWLIGWSWCLPTGFQTPLTYFYVIYFGTLLVHRQRRDEAKCSAKYGDAWIEYQKQVPYKIIPYIY
ncbi:ERG4/ERG24 ergosterol biosynthesis protein [Hyphopichia burtonii NRRL Y-1933]|uniref:Delta(14)-sterol reductase n=1 Tax=Hyphopichia burtonii NRRL Y-1933 TaxID=984485 RepID=A0A1E4RLB8_9ASCO|nr:ERG4/ERG24 ergosterol biosynthesis protein [Hyphopichia burtonii NRRL Y-1933]ODV68060.1 ERG4/ERG24 ergosterol biosynthesis protein [Hyphopichia burtonii NRRL Y-1933]